MITGYIKGQNLELRSPLVVADTIDYLTAQFVFQTVDWEGCRLFSHWECGETSYTIELSDAGKIEKEQHLNLTAGTWTVWIHGERYRDGKLIQRITTDEATLIVTATGTEGGSPFPEVPASDLERINAEIAELQDKVGSGGGSVPAGTDLVGHAMISLMGANYDSLEVTSITFPPDVTDEADQQRMLRSGAVKAAVSVAESEDELEAGVLDCIDTDGIRFTFAGITVGKNRTAFVIVDNFADTNEYQANVLAVHEGGGSSGDAMRLKARVEVPYEGTPPIIDMINFTRRYTYADIREAFVAGRTITLNTEYDVVPYQYGTFLINTIGSHGLEFHGHYWRVKDVEADVDEGWVPAVAFIREDGTLTVEDREWSGYAKQAEVDSLSKAIDDTETIGKLSIYDSSGTLLGSYQGEESDIKLPESNNTSTNINPVEATDEMIQPVGVDKEGKLFTAPAVSGLSSGAENWRIIKTLNFSTETSEISFDTDDNGDTFKLSEIMLTGTVPAFSGYIFIRDYSSLSSSHHGNNSVWPTASKNMTWWLASVNGKLKTLFGVSAKAVLEPVDANTGCPEKLTGLTIGASAGFTESGTMYVYGR